MTENTENTALPSTAQTQTESRSEPPRTGQSLISYVAILLSCGAIAGSGWQWYQQQLSHTASDISTLQQEQSALQQQLATHSNTAATLQQLAAKVNTLPPAINKQQDSLAQNNARIESINESITSLTQQISRLDNTTKEDWKLAEAEYLVRLANQRLLMEGDISGAENLLSNADDILAELADPVLFEARKALAQDIQALKATTSFDLEGVYLQLDALTSQVTQLPQREPSKTWQAAQDAQNDVTLTGWRQTLDELWTALKSLVVINYKQKPIKALLPPSEYQQLVNGIQIQIGLAQLAMLKKEAVVYQSALEKVATAVNDHFDTGAKSVSAFLTSVTSLQQINPSPELPLPRRSLTEMKGAVSKWNASQSEKSAEKTPTPASDTASEQSGGTAL